MFNLPPRSEATSDLISTSLTKLGLYALHNAARSMAAGCNQPLTHHPMDPYAPCIDTSVPIRPIDDDSATAAVIRADFDD